MSQIVFPSNPEDGDQFLAANGTTYQYDSATGQWKIVAGPGVQGPPGPPGTLVDGADINVGIVTFTTLHGGEFGRYSEKVNTIGNTGTSSNINVEDGTFVTATLDGNCTFTFTSPSTGTLYGFGLLLTNDASGPHSITWPTSVKWPGGATPSRTEADSKADLWSFFTTDGGTNWYGSIALYNFS